MPVKTFHALSSNFGMVKKGSYGESYQSVHDAATGRLYPGDDYNLPVGQDWAAPTNSFWVYRSGLYFDTTSLSGISGAYITGATLTLTPYSKRTTRSWDVVVVDASNIDYPPSAANFGYLRVSTPTLGQKDVSLFSTETETIISLDVSAIDTTVYTELGLKSSRDIDSDPPIKDETPPIYSTYNDILFYPRGSGKHPKLTVTYSFTPNYGYLWIEGNLLHWTPSAGTEKQIAATIVPPGAGGITPGYLWIAGIHLHYIDENGVHRRVAGILDGATGATAGYLWIEENYLRYIDAAGNERYLQGVSP